MASRHLSDKNQLIISSQHEIAWNNHRFEATPANGQVLCQLADNF
jgi:hypothetical protein